MATVYLFFTFILIFKSIECAVIQPETNVFEHLNFGYVKKMCGDRDTLCKSNATVICTVRMENDEFKYKDFENDCYLFLANICDNPDNEYHIIEGSSCNQYLSSRRRIQRRALNDTSVKLNVNNTKPGKTLRENKMKPLYEIETTFDEHICPMSCTDVYSPVCVSANRGEGKYFKYFTFANQCYGYIYYCKNYEQFEPPPGKEFEDVNSSNLGWSFCGAYRYLQFNRFAEMASAMGHYGWLQGDYRYSHIMEPHERKPGYG